MVTSIDSNLLLSYYNARAGLTGGTGTSSSSSSSSKPVAPTAPWTQQPSAQQQSDAVKAVMAGQNFVNENAAKLDVPGASQDYKKIFALYSALGTMGDLVTNIQKPGLTAVDKQRIQETFASGLKEISSYVTSSDMSLIRLTNGSVNMSATSTAPVPATQTDYTTGVLFSGTSEDPVPQFQGNVAFNIAVKRSGVTYNVAVDLSEMGSQTRSMANVVNYINGKLAAAGVDTRFATQRTAGADRTITAGGQTISLGTGPDQYALTIKPNGETVSFSAAATAPAVYLTQAVGNPNPDGDVTTNDGVISQQLLKFQTDTSAVDGPIQTSSDANWVDGRDFSKTLGPEIQTVHASKVGPDGSVYVLADVNAKTDGQDIVGSQDVALLKYDSAGNLVFTRTLGSSDTATGLGLAVSDTGQIAVAGSVTGVLNGSIDGALNSGPDSAFSDDTDSFVTVYNANGEEQWTERRAARLNDEASQVAFGSDGTVYVAGRTQSSLPGATSVGDWDTYLEAFAPQTSSGKVPVDFTTQFGTTSSDKPKGLVVNGNSVITATVENGHGVLRTFDVSSGSPVLTATRDLGDLQGGDITGLALNGGNVVVAGTTSNSALNAGTVTRAYSGGADAFAATFSADLTPGSGDAIAYYGGSGDDRATALSVSNGQVFIAGSAGTDLPGQPPVGTKDGFLAQIDISTGSIDWSRRFTGTEGYAAPSSIAVDATGASSLDRLGLPKGAIGADQSALLTANSSLRAGEQFTVRVGTSPAQTVTIDANETLDTLAQKIRRATGFQAEVDIGSLNGQRQLTVKPQNSRTTIEFGAGKTDKDALALLGIPEGVVRQTVVDKNGKSVPADGKAQIYGLGLESDLNLNDSASISHAAAVIAQAQAVITGAYRDLVNAATPQSAQNAAKASTGSVPAYLTNQIANYQAALDRLTGGSS